MSRAEQRALEAFPESYSGHNEYDRKCFVYGYEQAQKDLGWHSVDEMLPPLDEDVIVLTDIIVENSVSIGLGKIAFGHIVDTEKCIDYNGWNIPDVRYWMYCPKIPGEV